MASERGQTLYLKGTWGTQRQGGLVSLSDDPSAPQDLHALPEGAVKNGLLLQAILDYRALSQDTKERGE